MRTNPSLRDVARQAQVSVGTVSNVLNRPSMVSEETRNKVCTAIDMLGFIPKKSQSGFREQKIVGLILPEGTGPFFEELSQGIEEAVAQGGLRVLTGYSREDEAIQMQLLISMVEAGFSGIIITPVGERNQILEKYIAENVKVGFISQTHDQIEQCSVSIDQVRGGYIGIEYLAGLGHKKILWVSGPLQHHHSNQRFEGVTQAAKKFGVEISTIYAPTLDFITGEQVAPEILARGPLPDAVFCANDAIALGIMNFLSKSGYKIPGDVSFLGYDNVSYAESALVPLTTVSQTPYQLGFTLGSQMIAEIQAKEDHVHQHVIFQPQIVERASVAPKRLF